ncbi:hypothetical protein KTD31_02065 [Burkholderia multivorans]|jgi:hypothetical protein|uniref:hypothetical protein n=1 Tax=Burkholderia multivorans TaxID=87883 RepID=UPI001C2484B6|nr:hypothetical protein [Burkholderia multivorans]MBU9200190.1 hypothetical protein [Burkholderia multivorans]MDN8078686.1 hypothetical protein [Burkholderia multivorans]
MHTKTHCDLYRIYSNGEYASIGMSVWETRSADKPGHVLHGGELLIHSSFGNFCHTWPAGPLPFREMLLGIDFDTFMMKCVGESYRVFDGAASLVNVRRAVARLRRQGVLSQDDARDYWDGLEASEDLAVRSEECFRIALADLERNGVVPGAADDFIVYAASRQVQGFWREIWPQFTRILDAEVQAEQALAVKAA